MADEIFAGHTTVTQVYFALTVKQWEEMALKAKEHLAKTPIGDSRTFMVVNSTHEGNVELHLGVWGEEKSGIV